MGVGGALIAAVAVLGTVLVSTGPLDAQSRSNLGIGLLTGVIVGATLIGVEYALAKERTERERHERELQQLARLDYAWGRVAGMSQHLAREYEWRLHMLLERPSSGIAPRHFGRDDVRIVWLSTMWISDIDRTDPLWYRDAGLRETVDVTQSCAIGRTTSS